MPDREKVIQGLKCCSMDFCNELIECCPYGEEDSNDCMERLANDALILLKEQEVKPILIREGKSKLYNDYHCPRCGQEIVYEQNYCCECGSKVKWE